jgi:membrane associated rhomboid family serine protease
MKKAAHFTREYHSQHPWARLTWAVQRLILLTIGVYVVQLLVHIPFGRMYGAGQAGPPGGKLISQLAFQPDLFLQGYLWQPFTYIFVHAGLIHLFMNMLMLFFFGPDVERILGTMRFYRFYMFCGAAGVLATLVPGLNHYISVSGSSGAVMGVLAAFAVANPEREILLFPLPVPISARGLVIILIALNTVSALGGSTTSVATHLGGMAAGYVYMKAPTLPRWRRLLKKPPSPGPKNELDKIGEAVDNIFKLDEKNRQR